MSEDRFEFRLDASGRLEDYSTSPWMSGAGPLSEPVKRFLHEIHWISAVNRQPWMHADPALGVLAEVLPRVDAQGYAGVSGRMRRLAGDETPRWVNPVLEGYRDLLSSTRVISWQLDLGADRLVFVSSDAESILGYPASAWYNATFWETHLHPDDRGPAVEAYKAAIRERARVELEYRMVAADGRTVWFRDIIDTANVKGTYPYIRGAMIEITREKTAELAFRAASDEAARASRAKNSFLAYISHEIRSPINVILGFTDILSDPECAAGEREDAVSAVRSAGNFLMTFLAEIMDLARIESGDLEIRREHCHLSEIFSVAVAAVRLKAENKGLQLAVTVEPDAPEILYIDQRRLVQVVINLLENAIKYTDQGGIVVSVGCAGQELVICVEDTGPGIPPHLLADIFQPFRQAPNGLSRSDGIGIGLSICKVLTEKMGGTIAVKNRKHGGAAFSVSLPL